MSSYNVSVSPRYKADSTAVVSGLVLQSIQKYRGHLSLSGKKRAGSKSATLCDVCDVCDECEACDSGVCEACQIA